MPWTNKDQLANRLAFVQDATQTDTNMSALCRKYGISRPTGYKWLRRYQNEGEDSLKDRSRQPKHHPKQTKPEIEALIVAERRAHPSAGGQTIKVLLEKSGYTDIPCAKTITRILHRHDLISAEESAKHKPSQRYERDKPNELWQMDFKGDLVLSNGQHCYPLTILDDHSRFLLGIQVCQDRKGTTVKQHLRPVFQEFGLPDCFLVDNGPPWGSRAGVRYTIFDLWFIRLNIEVSHSRPFHPQTLGKIERMHRTLKRDVQDAQTFSSVEACQHALDEWRVYYNTQRPHQGIGGLCPVERYQHSVRCLPSKLPPIEYVTGKVRKVDETGKFSFANKRFYLGNAFRGQRVCIRPADSRGCFAVYYASTKVAILNFETRVVNNL